VRRARHDASRPRIEGQREAEVLAAALEVLTEVGYDRLTMDAVAQAARASKATLYRRWESKQALVVDAIGVAPPSGGEEDTGSLRGDLTAIFCGSKARAGARDASILAAVLSAMHSDEEFAREYRARFLAPKIDRMRRAFERAKARGEVRQDIDLDLFAPALAGIVQYRSMVLGEPLTERLAERVLDEIILPAATRSPDPKDSPR
jgi:AcrR family transcriptional regulator